LGRGGEGRGACAKMNEHYSDAQWTVLTCSVDGRSIIQRELNGGSLLFRSLYEQINWKGRVHCRQQCMLQPLRYTKWLLVLWKPLERVEVGWMRGVYKGKSKFDGRNVKFKVHPRTGHEGSEGE
jgi:hypothetical protein